MRSTLTVLMARVQCTCTLSKWPAFFVKWEIGMTCLLYIIHHVHVHVLCIRCRWLSFSFCYKTYQKLVCSWKLLSFPLLYTCMYVCVLYVNTRYSYMCSSCLCLAPQTGNQLNLQQVTECLYSGQWLTPLACKETTEDTGTCVLQDPLTQQQYNFKPLSKNIIVSIHAYSYMYMYSCYMFNYYNTGMYKCICAVRWKIFD